ncbi:MAG: hypothetical protein LLF91_07420 [Xanthomonadaceae bacterium]|nr:hypothetical protein [Xanthomonadaceae bacterium]
MILSRPTKKPKLLWAIFFVLLVVCCIEVPLVSFALITGDQKPAVAAYRLGAFLWAVGFTLAIVYAIRFLTGKYKDLKLAPLKKQRW